MCSPAPSIGKGPSISAIASKRRCKMTSCSQSTRRTMSSGSTNPAKSGQALDQLLATKLALRPKRWRVWRVSTSLCYGLAAAAAFAGPNSRANAGMPIKRISWETSKPSPARAQRLGRRVWIEAALVRVRAVQISAASTLSSSASGKQAVF
jgi:hypothetical protein